MNMSVAKHDAPFFRNVSSLKYSLRSVALTVRFERAVFAVVWSKIALEARFRFAAPRTLYTIRSYDVLKQNY